jgi:hypothetical protein
MNRGIIQGRKHTHGVETAVNVVGLWLISTPRPVIDYGHDYIAFAADGRKRACGEWTWVLTVV